MSFISYLFRNQLSIHIQRRISLFSTTTKKSLPPHQLIRMPALSPTMTAGTVGTWQKKVGERIEAGDVLVEIETDKAIMDFECQEEGYLAAKLIPSGTKNYPVNEPLAVLVDEVEEIDAFKRLTLDSFKSDTSKDKKQENEMKENGREKEENHGDKKENEMKEIGEEVKEKTIQAEKEKIIKINPLAKKIALQNNLNIEQINGTGPEGTITKEDVQKYLSHIQTNYTEVPLNSVQQITGQKLQHAKQQIPHFYLSVDINMNGVIRLKEKYKASINDFIIKAAALALQQVPTVNSQLHGDCIRKYKNADISIAIATEHGLITPIIRNANEKSLLEISEESKRLASLAKERRIRPEDYEGGTFTISNLGMYGIKSFQAIINEPQSAILAVGEVCKESGKMQATLSCDHRVIDGAVGAEWLKIFKEVLEKGSENLIK